MLFDIWGLVFVFGCCRLTRVFQSVNRFTEDRTRVQSKTSTSTTWSSGKMTDQIRIYSIMITGNLVSPLKDGVRGKNT